MATAARNRMMFSSKGLSYIEVMVAVVILMISVLAVLHAVALSTDQNFLNLCRHEAVKIAEAQINTLKNTAFISLVPGTSVLPTVTRNFGNHSRSFGVTSTVETLSATSSAIQVVVSWTHGGRQYQYSLSSIVSTGV